MHFISLKPYSITFNLYIAKYWQIKMSELSVFPDED